MTPKRKMRSIKTKFGSRDQVTYWEGMTMSRRTPLSSLKMGLNKVKQV